MGTVFPYLKTSKISLWLYVVISLARPFCGSVSEQILSEKPIVGTRTVLYELSSRELPALGRLIGFLPPLYKPLQEVRSGHKACKDKCIVSVTIIITTMLLDLSMWASPYTAVCQCIRQPQRWLFSNWWKYSGVTVLVYSCFCIASLVCFSSICISNSLPIAWSCTRPSNFACGILVMLRA